MTHDDRDRRDDAGLPRVHPGDARGDLGCDHEARVEPSATATAATSTTTCAPAASTAVHASKEFLAAGAPEVVVDGEVLEADPPRRLVQTWRMVMDADMAAEGFTRLTYEIAEGDKGVSRLTVTHDLTGRAAACGDRRRRASSTPARAAAGAWVLSDLKTLLETGSGFEG